MLGLPDAGALLDLAQGEALTRKRTLIKERLFELQKRLMEPGGHSEEALREQDALEGELDTLRLRQGANES